MPKTNKRGGRKWWWIGGTALLAAATGLAFIPGGAARERPQKVRTARAEVADVETRVTEVGSVEPQVKVDVKSVLSGRVVELLVREGDRVKRAQVLARVEPDVNQARDLSQVKNAVQEAEIALHEAQATFERNERLLAQGLVSAQAGLESETRFHAARAARDAALEKYRIVEQSGIPIGRAEAGQAQRLNVTSPMDGVVIRRPVELGDTVTSGVSSFNAGTLLMTVADVGTMIVKAGVNEVDVGNVRLEQHVTLTLDAYPKLRFTGEVQRIAPAARLEEKVKVFDVEIAIDRQGAELRAGMTANVDVLGLKREKVLTVPVEALFRRGDQEVVYVKKPPALPPAESRGFFARAFASPRGGPPATGDAAFRWRETFDLREVETGLASVDKVEVVRGLEAGEEVAVEDPTRPAERKDRE